MKISRLLFFIIFSLLITIYSCQKDGTGINTGQGTLNIYLTDAPAMMVYDSIKITFSQVSAHHDSGWITVTGNPMTVDLLEWTNGNTILVGSAEVPAGKYTQIRVIIDDAEIGVDGGVFPLDVPSGAQTGLKFGPEFTIEEGSTYELVMDFDANHSIVVNGPWHSPKGYKLKPHIRVIATAVSGSISGIVSNPADVPVAHAIQSGDTINTSVVDTVSGYFMLGFLPEGEYTVSVVDTNNLSFSQDNVMVTAGDDYDLGTFELQ